MLPWPSTPGWYLSRYVWDFKVTRRGTYKHIQCRFAWSICSTEVSEFLLRAGDTTHTSWQIHNHLTATSLQDWQKCFEQESWSKNVDLESGQEVFSWERDWVIWLSSLLVSSGSLSWKYHEIVGVISYACIVDKVIKPARAENSFNLLGKGLYRCLFSHV